MKLKLDALRKKREARDSRILVTGATGFLGSHIAVALLRAGFKVTALARPTKKLGARERIDRLAAWFALEGEARARLEVAEGDILDAGWPARAGGGSGDLGGIDEIVHCASNTAFAERKRAEVEAVNINGLENVLDLALRSGCGFFHHVSTASASLATLSRSMVGRFLPEGCAGRRKARRPRGRSKSARRPHPDPRGPAPPPASRGEKRSRSPFTYRCSIPGRATSPTRISHTSWCTSS